jgi:Uma2 family endonuclease
MKVKREKNLNWRVRERGQEIERVYRNGRLIKHPPLREELDRIDLETERDIYIWSSNGIMESEEDSSVSCEVKNGKVLVEMKTL